MSELFDAEYNIDIYIFNPRLLEIKPFITLKKQQRGKPVPVQFLCAMIWRMNSCLKLQTSNHIAKDSNKIPFIVLLIIDGEVD